MATPNWFKIEPFKFDPEFYGETENLETQAEMGELEGESRVRRRTSSGSPRQGQHMSRTSTSAYNRPGAAQGHHKRHGHRPRPFPEPYPVDRYPYGPSLTVVQDRADSEPPEDGAQDQPGSEQVRWAQNALNQVLNLSLPVDGTMDVETRSAIRSFQRKWSLPVDGILGPDTERALQDAVREKPAVRGRPAVSGTRAAPSQRVGTATAPVQPGLPERVARLRRQIVHVARQEWNRWNTGGKKFERDEQIRPTLQDYWQTGAGMKVSPASLGTTTWQKSHPWSAAFISWVMRKAGAGREFAYSPSHSTYISAAKQNRVQKKNNIFKAYRIHEVKLEPGDLVCKSRAGSGATYENIRPGMKTHCDVVVEVQPGKAITIGGNVGDSVSKTTVKLDAQGHISSPNYFAVIKIKPAHSG